MRIIIIIILVFFSFLYASTGYSSRFSSEPIHLSKYHETIVIQANGEAVSHINLILTDSYYKLYLPLLISDEIVLLNSPADINASITGVGKNKYLLLQAKTNMPLDSMIQLDISYDNMLKGDNSWNFTRELSIPFDYSEIDSRNFNIDDYNVTITLPPNLSIKLPNNISELLTKGTLSIIHTDIEKTNEVNLSAYDLKLVEVDLEMIINKGSIFFAPYFITIVLLLAVYGVFLRYVFAG